MDPQIIPTKDTSKNVETGKREFSKNESAQDNRDSHLDEEMDETPEEISREGNKGIKNHHL